MARDKRGRSLCIWLNGFLVGTWSVETAGIHSFRYENSWLSHPRSRPISLSLPLGENEYRGEVVSSFFENLLPDSTEIRQRIRNRYHAASLKAFDLLWETGRDCVGAIQLLPPGKEPTDLFRITGKPLSEPDIAGILKGLSTVGYTGTSFYDDFRISLAGAQEKTALLWHEGCWQIPCASTPSTHIIKLPLGRIGGLGFDMSHSVENEWLCSRLVTALGFQTAVCEVADFEDVHALVVERFDRRLVADPEYIIRLPQEDFCQVTGTSPDRKYESDGGPGIEPIMDNLLGSREADLDRKTFFGAQILFWLLAAPDGHAKNFSVFIEAQGRYRLTPLYDIISAWPVLGYGKDLIPPEKLKLAMAIRGKNKHYEWKKISLRHFKETARRCGFEHQVDVVFEDFSVKLPLAIESVQAALPAGFPAIISDSIFEGALQKVKLLG